MGGVEEMRNTRGNLKTQDSDEVEVEVEIGIKNQEKKTEEVRRLCR